MRNWQIDYTDPLLLSKDSKYTLVCVDTISGLTQAFFCHCANQAATIKGLKKLSTMYGYSHHIDNDRESHFKGPNMQDWAAEHDIE